MSQIVSNRSSIVAAFIIFHIRHIQVQKTANQLLLIINCSPIGLKSEGTWVAKIMIVSRQDIWGFSQYVVLTFVSQ